MTARSHSMGSREGRLALVAGGGSGGHVFPGLAVARELKDRGWRVGWIGRPKTREAESIESRIVGRESRVEFHGLPALPLVGKGMFDRARGAAVLATSTLRARALVRRLGAQVVLGTGGYASVPAVLGAKLAGVPTLLLEPNAEAGAANRLLSRWAAEALVAHDVTARGLRCPSTTTGVPVRSEFFDVATSLPFGEPLRLLVLGGSQGAQSVNEALPAAVALLRKGSLDAPLFVRHQAGAQHVERARKLWKDAGIEPSRPGAGWQPDGAASAQNNLQVEVTPFLSDVAGAMSESHLILSRAGAITLAEICAAGRPSLLLPLALAGGHQEANAHRLKDAGAAQVLVQGSQSGGANQAAFQTSLSMALGTLLADRKRLDAMAGSARRLGRRDAAGAIADRLEARAQVRQNGGSGAHLASATEATSGGGAA